MPPELWRPTCELWMLQLRAALLTATRAFFDERGYLEVETPLLSHDIVVDAHLEPFTVADAADQEPLFLQTSPEAGMKRLLAAGSGSIFQVTRSFRKAEQGTRHNPEFTMLEWYGVDTTYHDQMRLTEELVRHCGTVIDKCPNISGAQKWSNAAFGRRSYDTAFPDSQSGILELTIPQLQALVAEHTTLSEAAHAIENRDDLLNILLAECVEPHLGKPHPQFLCDYPLSQAALAEQNAADERTACRFELYIDGLEICNGYQELTDPHELQQRDQLQNASRTAHQTDSLPGAKHLIAAMQSGLPKCSGVALGFDRLIMSLTGLHDISKIIAFPQERA